MESHGVSPLGVELSLVIAGLWRGDYPVLCEPAHILSLWGELSDHAARATGDLAWSLWEGFLKMPSGAALQELLAEHQISLISVHASGFDLRRLVGGRCCAFFPRVERHADGDWWQAGSR